MIRAKKRRVIVEIILVLTILSTIAIGISIGVAIAATLNTDIRSDITTFEPALPTQILDRHGNLITALFSDEKRDIVPIDELPRHLIYALITREDDTFFEHHGFSIKGTARAAWNVLRGRYFSGGSTLTQQIAGRYYADRTQITFWRKIRELWYAFQMERSLTKKEILELYLNEMYFGHNTYGVEAASQYYFGHSARDISVAEAALLVIQLASPARYSPINHPERARARQKDVLDQMVSLDYVTEQKALQSFQEYWDNYDFRRSNISSAYIDNLSKAPYFSEYVRLQLNDMLYGAADIHKDGYVVHTTLDLTYQNIADSIMGHAFQDINERHRRATRSRLDVVEAEYLPVIDLLSLAFDIKEIQVSGAREQRESKNYYYSTINPAMEMLSLVFGIDELKNVSRLSYQERRSRSERSSVEGALVTIDNNTGHILAMVGGSDYETRQYNRAVNARVLPGSAFKPLYYAAAISSGRYTSSTRFYDGPIMFYDDDGNSYTPLNFLGAWHGHVLLRDALAHSMNIPSLQILDGIGFDAAISTSSRLLGMQDRRDNRTLFPRSFPFGLGVTALAPIDMARAFAVFPNQGNEVTPTAITQVLDRNRNVIIDVEKDRIREQQRNRAEREILSPQAAYIMVDLLKSTVDYGTLRWRRINVGGFDGMPMAGKTGTTQNWGDAWTVGFSPYYTTAIWFGFDSPGLSLGRELTGATAAGPVWAEYMKKLHADLSPKPFDRPEAGLVEVMVCRKSGMLPSADCTDGTITELFVAGTEPQQLCTLHSFERERHQQLVNRLVTTFSIEDFNISTHDLPRLQIDVPSEYSIDTGTRRLFGDDPFYEHDIDSFGIDEDFLHDDSFNDFDIELDSDIDPDDDSDVNPFLD